MNSIHIVIVEDNPVDVLMVREALNNQSIAFSLEHHSNGGDAARAISAMIDAPSLFLLDLNIPRVHGLELLRIVRACPAVSKAPVAILTSSQAAEDRVRSVQYGADAYIVKPQGYHEFVKLVGAAIGSLLTRGAHGSCSRVLGPYPFGQATSGHWRDVVSIRCGRTASRGVRLLESIMASPAKKTKAKERRQAVQLIG